MNIQVILIRCGLENWSILATSTWLRCYDMRDVQDVAVVFSAIWCVHIIYWNPWHINCDRMMFNRPRYVLLWKILKNLSSYDESVPRYCSMKSKKTSNSAKMPIFSRQLWIVPQTHINLPRISKHTINIITHFYMLVPLNLCSQSDIRAIILTPYLFGVVTFVLFAVATPNKYGDHLFESRVTSRWLRQYLKWYSK